MAPAILAWSVDGKTAWGQTHPPQQPSWSSSLGCRMSSFCPAQGVVLWVSGIVLSSTLSSSLSASLFIVHDLSPFSSSPEWVEAKSGQVVA